MVTAKARVTAIAASGTFWEERRTVVFWLRKYESFQTICLSEQIPMRLYSMYKRIVKVLHDEFGASRILYHNALRIMFQYACNAFDKAGHVSDSCLRLVPMMCTYFVAVAASS